MYVGMWGEMRGPSALPSAPGHYELCTAEAVMNRMMMRKGDIVSLKLSHTVEKVGRGRVGCKGGECYWFF